MGHPRPAFLEGLSLACAFERALCVGCREQANVASANLFTVFPRYLKPQRRRLRDWLYIGAVVYAYARLSSSRIASPTEAATVNG